MEMLVSTINIINQRLERIDVCEKLSKLDQKIDERFDKIEKCITNIYQEIENVKTTILLVNCITSLFLKFHGNNFPYTFAVFVVRKAGYNIAGSISNFQMNMHVMQSIEKKLKRNRVALLLFIQKYCQFF
jgi:N-glycosylase/DNA lyase